MPRTRTRIRALAAGAALATAAATLSLAAGAPALAEDGSDTVALSGTVYEGSSSARCCSRADSS